MIIVRKEHRVLVQGITGKQGTFWTEKMLSCGTRVVGGVNPRRAGELHLGVPVFASAEAAMAQAPFDTAVMFIPPSMAKEAALDACRAGAKLLVILTEHIPAHDVMAIHAAAARRARALSDPTPPAWSHRAKPLSASCPGTTPASSSRATSASSRAAAASARWSRST